ncbi:GH23463 [Drosophila grimshawi]|uniref:GH23463 n=1 Tax=Drosophila grimshawi TaxID=7222 RepID=B4K0V2_DROGR|nr:GH23463 [Drosophila grimshawi]
MSEPVKEALYLKALLNSVGKDCATLWTDFLPLTHMFHRLAQALKPSKNLCVTAAAFQAVVEFARNTVSSAYVASSVFQATGNGKSAVHNVVQGRTKHTTLRYTRSTAADV